MKKFAPLTSLVALGLSALPVFAQSVNIPQPPGFKITSMSTLVSNTVGAALIFAAILVFVFLVWGGIQWITSGGDKGKTEEARNRITAALVGLAIVACSWAIIELVSYFFGIDIFGSDSETMPKAY